MDRQSAINFIRETFENSFEKEKYIGFVKNLFNKISLEPFEFHGQYIPDTFKPYINKYERVGKYAIEDKRIDILIVYLSRETSIERARTMQRNFVAGYLTGKYGSNTKKDAAVVAFVSPGLDDWRFSLVKMEYKLTQTKTGRPKGEEEFTPARRYSFLVGKNEPNHTAQQHLFPILQDDVNNPTLEQLEEAFSVEKVTDEFLDRYRELYLQLKNSIDKIVKKDKNILKEFENKNINTVDFSKKLLGQIVFLYFLQKKGWLGVPKDKNWGEGHRNFLRSLFDKCSEENRNFFNDYLEVLFYDTLNNPRTNQADSTYSEYFDCRIPFLNGGLFEPVNNYDWRKTDIIIPNELFSNNKKTEEGDIGTGILDVFDRYNFTVQEDEPLEKEVALDPELLGKVFENLIEENIRKGQGAYYTPREIVHYMCQESLINYLSTELECKVNKEDIEILIKYGDIAIEHDKLVIAKKEEKPEYNGKYKKIKMPESVKDNAKLIDEKLENIRVCDPAVGSGAFPIGMMLEIVKARNILTNYISDKEGRTPYNFKRHCIENCLYGVDIDSSAIDIAKLRFWLSLIVDEEDITKIKPLPNLDYKLVCGNSLLGVERDLFNAEAFKKLEELKPLYFNETDTSKKQELKNQINELIKQIKNNDEHFDFEVYFSEVFHEKKGFDVVIGNPPWGQKSVKFTEQEKKYFKIVYPSAIIGTLDIFRFFIEKAIGITASNGSFANVLPDIILLKNYSSTRKFILENLSITKIDHWGMAFKNVNLDSCTIIGKKTKTNANNMIVATIHSKNSIITNQIQQMQFFKNDGYKFNLYLEASAKKLLEKLRSFKTFGDYFEPHEGIHSGNIRNKLFTDKKLDSFSRKLIFGRKEVQRFKIEWSGKWVNYNPNIVDRKKGEYAGLGNPEYFDNKKIVVRRTGDYILAALDESGYYFSNNIFVCLPKGNSNLDMKYVLGILNSKLATWFYRTIQPRKGKLFAELKINILKQIPIKEISKDKQKQVISLVDKIISIKKDKNDSNTAHLEKEIDKIIYTIYELDKDEINLIENDNK